MVVLDSNHTHQRVLDELCLYGPLVTEGKSLVVSDTVADDMPTQTRWPREWGLGNHPKMALREYLGDTDRFEPDPWFNSKALITSSRGRYLRRAEPTAVTIGLSVHNGAAYPGEALTSRSFSHKTTNICTRVTREGDH